MVIYKGDHTQDIIRLICRLVQRGEVFGTPSDMEKAYTNFSREEYEVNWKMLSGAVVEEFVEWLDGRDIPEVTK